MKKILIGLLVFTLVYLLFAFIKWDLNAGNWEEFTRIGCGIASFFFSIPAIIFNEINKTNK